MCGPPEYDVEDMNNFYDMKEQRIRRMMRYFLASDDDGHWYVVAEEHRREWEEWRDIDSDDERAWTPPPFARSLGCSPTRVTFTDPRTS
jgi:hypothetical protein